MADYKKVTIESNSRTEKGSWRSTQRTNIRAGERQTEQFPSTDIVTETQPAHTVTRRETNTSPASITKRTTTAEPSTITTTTTRPETSSTRTETKKSHLSIKFSFDIPIHSKEPRGA